MAKEVITVTMDKEFYELLMANAPQGGGGNNNRTVTIRSINHYDESQQTTITLEIPTGIVTWREFIELKAWPSGIEFEMDEYDGMMQITYYNSDGNYGLLKYENDSLVDANDEIIFGAEYEMEYA